MNRKVALLYSDIMLTCCALSTREDIHIHTSCVHVPEALTS